MPEADRSRFTSLEHLLGEPMEQVTLDRRSGVARLRGAANYYVKTFQGRGNRLKHALGISRFQREIRNLRLFKELGLNTPEIVAYGESSRLGILDQAALVTREVTGARDLRELLDDGAFYRDGNDHARAVLNRLAKDTRALHDAAFYHRDLKTRNILLGGTRAGPKLYFLDCPSGHRVPRLLIHRCVVRDLAHLERGLRGKLRSVDLLYLYKCYRGSENLTEEDKVLAREVLGYYANRRMTRKRRRREKERRQRSVSAR